MSVVSVCHMCKVSIEILNMQKNVNQIHLVPVKIKIVKIKCFFFLLLFDLSINDN